MRLNKELLRYAAIALGGLAFGAADQYLGTIHVSRYLPASVTVSGLSAPWLLVPFLVGATQRRNSAAALVGFAVTLCALTGWIVMILSPVEGVHLSAGALLTTTLSQGRWFAAATVSGPVYGWLGHRWRTSRSWLSALLAAAPLVLEALSGLFQLWPGGGAAAAYAAELAQAMLAVSYFAVAGRRAAQAA